MRIAKIVAPIVGVLLFAAPAFVSAQTADDIRAQIQSLLSQITALQAQLSNLTFNTPTTISTSSNACPNLYRALSRGSRGSDVISLQQFLIAQGLLNGDSATGFFGSMTEAAVQRWQAQNGVDSVGIVGVRTRAAIAARCGVIKPPVVQSCPQYQIPICTSGQHVQRGTTDADGCQGAPMCVNDTVVQSCPVYNACPSGYSTNTSTDSNGCAKISCIPVSQNTGSFTVSQTSGSAPLTVTFSGSSGQSVVSEVAVWIDFGDGSVDDSIGPGSFSKSHTYTSPGTYTAKLQWRTFGQASSNFPTNTVGTVTIIVTGQTADTIRVISPNGGESYRIGDTVTLQSIGGHRSDTGGVENGYFLVDSAGNSKEIVYAGNSYSWTIASYRDGIAIVPGTYKIRVTSSFGPCPNAACAQTIQDDSDGTFTITQGTNISAAGTLEGTATISAGMSCSDAMLSINKREEKPDPYRGTSYTLTNVGIVTPKSDCTFSVSWPPGTYWIELTGYNSPSENGVYFWPKVVGLAKTVTITSGQKTILNYSIDTSH